MKTITNMETHGTTFLLIMRMPVLIDGEKMELQEFLITSKIFVSSRAVPPHHFRDYAI